MKDRKDEDLPLQIRINRRLNFNNEKEECNYQIIYKIYSKKKNFKIDKTFKQL